jgi:hypothetical protein
MSISTKLSSSERREKTEELLTEHQWKFLHLHVENPLFIPKSAYIPRGKTEHYVSFFPSELIRQQDIYLEFVSYDLIPEDSSRTLYKLRANPYYDEEYEKTEGDSFRYLVPVKELEKIEIINPESETEFIGLDDLITKPVAETKISEIKTSDIDNDYKLSDITVRDFAAIMLKKPISSKEWLNKLINFND